MIEALGDGGTGIRVVGRTPAERETASDAVEDVFCGDGIRRATI